jgi:hypothetical protein
MSDKLNEAIASLLHDKSKRQSLAELLVEYVQPEHIATDYVSMLLNTRQLNAGDSLVKRIRKGVKVYTFVPGSVHLAGQISVSERINYVLDGILTKVSFSEWDLQNGTIGTVEEIRAEMLAKLRDAVQNKVFTALSTIWSAVNTPLNYINVGGPVTATVLEDAINRVAEVTGGVQAVVGIRTLMNPITKFGAFVGNGAVSETFEAVPGQMQQVVDNGYLGKYYGANLVYLQQQWNNPEDYATLLPTDKILVIGKNVGDFITFGDVMSKEYTDPRPTPSEWVLENWQQIGMIIDQADGIYVIGGVTAG